MRDIRETKVYKLGKAVINIENLVLPVIKNTVFFQSFQGLYSDNPKYISEELHRRFPDVQIVWGICDEAKDSDFPDYVKLVKKRTFSYKKYCGRAEVVVGNSFGNRTAIISDKHKLKAVYHRFMSRRKKGQLSIATWHGTPLKHISLDEPQFDSVGGYQYITDAGIVIAGCRLTADAFRTAMNWDGKVHMCGTPRNDILFKNVDVSLKDKLGLLQDKRVCLFAPTFRNNVYMSGVAQLAEMDIEALKGQLHERFGGEWIFVFRSHYNVMKEIKENYPDLCDSLVDGNQHPDMAEYLACTDVLITDYSSSMFDFALTGKPCFLYTPDYETYKNDERGFYIKMEELPFSYEIEFENVLKDIGIFDEDKYKASVSQFLEDIENCEEGRASEYLVNKIAGFMQLSDGR